MTRDGALGMAGARAVKGQGRRQLLEPAGSHHSQETPVAVQTLSREEMAGLRSSGPALMGKQEGDRLFFRERPGRSSEERGQSEWGVRGMGWCWLTLVLQIRWGGEGNDSPGPKLRRGSSLGCI